MENNPTPPAPRTFCVWADWNRRVYQEIDAATPEEAHRLANENPGGWQACVEHDDNGFRLSNDVQDVESGENFTIGTVSHCTTCGSEIVETVNDSSFNDGECGPCEYQRYKSQSALLEALEDVNESLTDFYKVDGRAAGENFGAALKDRMVAAIANAKAT